ncbi:MAG: TonB family protein [Pseudomonadales bacterium]|nr:TonB family protein [Pseudomonadales bacterium]
MRYGVAFALAAAITCGIFLIIYHLINEDVDRQQMLENLTMVELFQPPPPQEDEPEPEPEPEEPEQFEEPTLPELELDTPSPTPSTDLSMPAMDFSLGEFNMKTNPGSFIPPAGGIATGPAIGEAGKGNTGFREVVPAATRQPDIPRIAWENKIDGWVLVAFTIVNDGRVTKVRILDAYPRGIFEEEVVKSVQDWNYDPFKGPPVQLTQKIELFWKDFPNNIFTK